MLESAISLELNSPIELIEISEFNQLVPTETIYLCNYVGVVFEGITYQAIGCEGSGFEAIGKGAPSEPRLRISNVGNYAADFLTRCRTFPNHRLLRAIVTRRLTTRSHLDGGPLSGAAIREEPHQIYEVAQMEQRTDTFVTLRLSTPDLSQETLPARPALRTCPWVYRGADCSYAGEARFTDANVPTLDPLKDKCAHSLTACELRFGPAVDLPFGGFPGLANYG